MPPTTTLTHVEAQPHSVEAERTVIGALLIDPDAIIRVCDFLRPEDFYDPTLRQIFEAIFALYQQHEPIDFVTVSSKLTDNKKIQEIGGSAFLAQLASDVPTASHIYQYGQIVKTKAVHRRIIAAGQKISALGYEEGRHVPELLEEVEKMVFQITNTYLKEKFMHIRDILEMRYERFAELHESKEEDAVKGVPTGFNALDTKLSGLQPSDVIIIAARPSMGKSSLALNIAQNASFKHKLPVGFFSLEMSREELMDRLLVAQAEIDAWKLKTGRLDEGEFTKLSDAMGELYETPLYIDDTPGASILEMRTKARRLQAEHGLRLIIVDYLQLARPVRNLDNRVQEVSEISQGLKNLARELKIPVLALSQLSRQVESRGVKKPQLADLRESGAIEQDADVVMFMWRENDENLENMNLDIAKHRNGPLRSLKLRFKGDRIKFYSVEAKRKAS